MAERRMFAKAIVNSARFLRMPPSSRLLYYDLGMNADDDGVVEAFTVMRTTGATEDDLHALVAREFVTVLNDDLVSYINDWKRNNLIKKDRYRESLYAHLLVRMQDGTQMEPEWNPNGTQMEPQVRLGKVRLGKGRLGEADGTQNAPTPEEVRQFMEECSSGAGVDVPRAAERFCNYHASKGWRLADWRPAARNWIEQDAQSARTAPANPALNYEQRAYTEADYAELMVDLSEWGDAP